MKKSYQHKYSEQGIALLPVIIIVAVLAVFGSGSAVVYQIQKSNEAETSALRQELQALQEQNWEDSVAEKLIEEDIKEEEESSSTLLPPSEYKPEFKATVTFAPVASQPVANKPSVPLIVEQEFEKVYGRKPTGSESTEWKNKLRANNWSRTELYNAMMTNKSSQLKSLQSAIVTNVKETPKTSSVPTLNVNVPSSTTLKKYIVETKVDFKTQIIREYPTGKKYLIESGVGCISLSFQTIVPFYIEQSGFLDGIGDKAIIPSMGQSCIIWKAKAL